MSPTEDSAVDESLDKNSQEGKSRESSGQLLACSRIFIVYLSYILSYNLPVHSCRKINMAVFEVPL